jgi:hypothetical protein
VRTAVAPSTAPLCDSTRCPSSCAEPHCVIPSAALRVISGSTRLGLAIAGGGGAGGAESGASFRGVHGSESAPPPPPPAACWLWRRWQVAGQRVAGLTSLV